MRKRYIGYYSPRIKTYQIYEDNNMGYYLALGSTAPGFDYKTVEEHEQDPYKFLISADTLEEIQQISKRMCHIYKYGAGKQGDCACPVCGYKYEATSFRDYEGDYDDTTIECICGTKLNIRVEVILRVEKSS